MQIQQERNTLPPREQVVQQIAVAQNQMKQRRTTGLATLNALFRSGVVPDPPLDGAYAGKLVAFDVAPGVTQLAETLAASYMPWRGKLFFAQRASGDNLLARNSRLLLPILSPGYHGVIDDGGATYQAFEFNTSIGAGKVDTDRQVLKLDYDLPSNPRTSVRRVLDEVVEVAGGLYLGKAHVHWWWGRWQLVAYFTLSRSS